MGFFDAITGALGGLFGGGQTESNPVSGFMGSMGKGFGSQIGQGVGNQAMQGFFPSPSASQQGSDAADYMNKAYPGTTPWEQLGGGGAASFSGVQTQERNQSKAVNSQAYLNSQTINQQDRVNTATIKNINAKTAIENEELKIKKAQAKYADPTFALQSVPNTPQQAMTKFATGAMAPTLKGNINNVKDMASEGYDNYKFMLKDIGSKLFNSTQKKSMPSIPKTNTRLKPIPKSKHPLLPDKNWN